jgi:hypothetical protein
MMVVEMHTLSPDRKRVLIIVYYYAAQPEVPLWVASIFMMPLALRIHSLASVSFCLQIDRYQIISAT